MTSEPNVLRSLALAASASLVLLAGGCAANAPPPAQAPLFTSAVIAPAPAKAPPARLVVVSPNVSVSEELVAACKLNLDNVDSAPKFDFDRSALVAQDNAVLSQIANCVTNGPLAGRALDLVGRADPRGTGEYNMALGGRRASSVRDYLSGLGVDGTKLSLSSRGELDSTGTDESGWQRDRRVDILLH